MFEQQFAYDGELGALYTKEKTTFRVWSPVSKSITLRLYRSGTPAYLNPLGNNNYIEKEIKNNLKSYFNSLNHSIIKGKLAEKELNELLNSKIIL